VFIRSFVAHTYIYPHVMVLRGRYGFCLSVRSLDLRMDGWMGKMLDGSRLVFGFMGRFLKDVCALYVKLIMGSSSMVHISDFPSLF
jgi:hypothetical protein